MTDEVKRCVEILRKAVRFGVIDCQYCPAYSVCPTGTVGWNNECMLDTAADLIESLAAELEQVKRERDAAIADMERLQGLICQVCKEYYQPDPESREYSCRVYGDYFGEIAEDGLLCCGKFKWRGVQEEKNAE